MKKQGPLILAGLAVAALLYYFFLRKGQGATTSAAARGGGSGAGGPTPITPLNAANFVPTSSRPPPLAGAPVPTLAQSLATTSVQTLGSILSRLVGGGGGSGSSGSGSSSPFNVRGTPIGNSSSLTGFPSRSNSQLSTTGGIGHAPPDTSQGPYYRDPSTGILYDPNGNPVGEQPQDTSPGIPYDAGGTPQSVDLSTGGSVDFGSELAGGGYQDTSGTYSDSGGVSSVDLSGGGDSGGGGGGGDIYQF